MRPIDKEYKEHPVFDNLQQFEKFYKELAFSIFSFPTQGTTAIANIDTYVYSSIQGTVESMRTILLSGRINDAYTLLRKFHDSVTINIYTNLYLKDHFSLENFQVEKINNWLHNKEKLPEYRQMAEYIKKSPLLKPMSDLLSLEQTYKNIRNRCNDHTHYNFFSYAMLNDNEVHIKDRQKWLDHFYKDSRDIFTLHLGYIFLLNDHYMVSSGYIDALECDMIPEVDSQYWVAPFIQNIFDEILTPHRPDITNTIKANTSMQLK